MLHEILDLKAMSAFAARSTDLLGGGHTVCLSGALGAGKTTFVRLFCQAAGAREPVSSPSFVMENEYHTAQGLRIEHWDLYRTREAPQEILEPPDKTTLRFVEWPEHALELLVQADLVIKLAFHDNPLSEGREIGLSGRLAEDLRKKLSP